ncbi:hypothetical protein EBT25_17965, partial [bacterium]|nr:hypothetical protein [bacterium]
MDIHFIPIAKDFLSENEIAIADSVNTEELVYVLAKHFDALVYNITSLAALVAIIQEKKKIQPRHLISAQAYIAHKCVGETASKKITGGVAKNISVEEMDKMEIPVIEVFQMAIETRPPIKEDIRGFVRSVLDHHELTIGKDAMKKLLSIMYAHLACLAKDVKAE